MSRVLMFLGLVALAVAIAALLLSIWRGAWAIGQQATRSVLGSGVGEPMAPNGIQKIAYAALLVLLFGVSTGWLGGL